MLTLLQKGEAEGWLDGELVDKIHLCPSCSSAHQNLRATCPKCKTVDIAEEDLVHHFPCANIAPIRDFKRHGHDGLHCKKCDKDLRHIGNDYDKPSTICTCNSCRHTFQQARYQSLCMDCGEASDVQWLHARGGGASWLGIYRIISGAFGAVRTSALQQVGGWDIGPGLDGDITVKLRKSGYRIRFEPSAICLTTGPKEFKGLWKQRSRWSRSIVRFRLRKHRDVLLPHRNFSWSNFISFAENLWYSLILDFKWFIYFFDVAINYSRFFDLILPFNTVLYVLTGYAQMFVISMFSERARQERHLWWYVPLMVPYTAFYLRWCNTLAYLRELPFKASYQDPWNPQKSSYQALQHGY